MPIVVNLILRYTYSEVVIPAKAGMQLKNTGFRVKPGMTDKGKGFTTHYTILFKDRMKSKYSK